MTGGQGRYSNPPLAISPSIYSPSMMFSRSPFQTSKQKTRRNGCTPYKCLTFLNRRSWKKCVWWLELLSIARTISENTGDVIVGSRSLRKPRVV